MDAEAVSGWVSSGEAGFGPRCGWDHGFRVGAETEGSMERPSPAAGQKQGRACSPHRAHFIREADRRSRIWGSGFRIGDFGLRIGAVEEEPMKRPIAAAGQNQGRASSPQRAHFIREADRR